MKCAQVLVLVLIFIMVPQFAMAEVREVSDSEAAKVRGETWTTGFSLYGGTMGISAGCGIGVNAGIGVNWGPPIRYLTSYYYPINTPWFQAGVGAGAGVGCGVNLGYSIGLGPSYGYSYSRSTVISNMGRR
jgi:hypothetical protein